MSSLHHIVSLMFGYTPELVTDKEHCLRLIHTILIIVHVKRLYTFSLSVNAVTCTEIVQENSPRTEKNFSMNSIC